jgi:hypothetical protein
MRCNWVYISILLFHTPVAQRAEATVSKTVHVWVQFPPGVLCCCSPTGRGAGLRNRRLRVSPNGDADANDSRWGYRGDRARAARQSHKLQSVSATLTPASKCRCDVMGNMRLSYSLHAGSTMRLRLTENHLSSALGADAELATQGLGMLPIRVQSSSSDPDRAGVAQR